MQFAETEICQITESVWWETVGLEVQRIFQEEALTYQEQTLAGCMQLTGAWEGAVALHCAAGLARQAAGVMFGIDPESTSVEEVQDALAELANMTGGNLKTLLPEPCHLSLPIVVACAVRMAHATALFRTHGARYDYCSVLALVLLRRQNSQKPLVFSP